MVLNELVERHVLSNVSTLVHFLLSNGLTSDISNTKIDWYRNLMLCKDTEPLLDGAEPDYLVPLKFYLVSSDLAKVLRQLGAPVALQDEMWGLNVWGRCGTGYALENEDILIEAFGVMTTTSMR